VFFGPVGSGRSYTGRDGKATFASLSTFVPVSCRLGFSVIMVLSLVSAWLEGFRGKKRIVETEIGVVNHPRAYRDRLETKTLWFYSILFEFHGVSKEIDAREARVISEDNPSTTAFDGLFFPIILTNSSFP
jgi:hypothetical protein